MFISHTDQDNVLVFVILVARYCYYTVQQSTARLPVANRSDSSLSTIMIRRRAAPQEDSSDEDDVDMFAKLPKEQPISGAARSLSTAPSNENSQGHSSIPVISSMTSSMKRHHIALSNTRKKQMDALIQELETEKSAVLGEPRGLVPDKRGSYVEPEDEHRTTNLFVGNLAPTLTEEAIIDVFARFGDLLSLKVMWPRTAEERERNRVSCFVCYRYRRDAEAAMDACSESDPFFVGRRLMVRWGKNMLPNTSETLAKRQRSNPVDEQPQEGVSIHSNSNPAKRSGRAEHRRRGRPIDGSGELEPDALEEFYALTRRQLCASRESICAAMAFCFKHSSASSQISEHLKDLLLDDHCSVATRVARLFLLSDVLFNSQQPGIKNAFRYRDAIEKMAPAVFASLGQHGDAALSRMTRHKIQVSVRAVLAAWTNWSVFDPIFLDELEACFEGREIIKPVPVKEEMIDKSKHGEVEEDENEIIILAARGDWTEVNENDDADERQSKPDKSVPDAEPKKVFKEQTIQLTEDNVLEDDLDGEPLEEGDLDEEGLRRLNAIHQVTDDDDNDSSKAGGHDSVKGTMEHSDIDGEPLGDHDELENIGHSS